MNEEQDIWTSAPLLSSLEKEKINAPEGYLENLEMTVLKAVKSRGKVISLAPKRFFYMAAGLALLMGLLWLLRTPEIPQEQDLPLDALVDQLSIEEIDYFVNMDEALIEEVYLEYSQTTTSPEIEYLIDDDVWSDELIIEYL